MILGIGTDIVSLSEFEQMLSEKSFLTHTFTEGELALAEPLSAGRRLEFLAGRFSVKEALSKALSPFIGEDSFDMRKIETLALENGAPVVSLTPPLSAVLQKHGSPAVHVSITHDGNYVLSFVIIESVESNGK